MEEEEEIKTCNDDDVGGGGGGGKLAANFVINATALHSSLANMQKPGCEN